MKKKEAEEILVRITDKYKPFHPEKSQSVRVLARLLRHVADDIYDEDALFCFELLTREQVNDILSERNGVRFSYYFKAFLPRNSNEYETIVERIPRNSYFWVTICSTDNSGYNSANGSIQLDGYTALRTPIPKKYWSDERMHHNGDARMVIGDSTNAEEQNLLENFVQVTDSYKDSYGANSGTDSLSDISGIESGNTNGSDSNGAGKDFNEEDKSIFSSSKTNVAIRIIKVGSANATHIRYKNGKTILFDCGIDQKKPFNYADGEAYIKTLKPNTIIISHWHLDHYELLDFINDDELEQVIVLDYSKVKLNSQTEQRLNSWKTGKIKFVVFNKSLPANILGNDYPNTYLFIGEGKTPTNAEKNTKFIGYDTCSYQDTIINDSGIIIAIKFGSRKIIMPSDVSYYSWPDDQLLDLGDCEKLIVPHHACQIYGLKSVPQNTNINRLVYISHFTNNFYDLAGSTCFNRSIIDEMLNDKTISRHKYTCDITNKTKPYYLVVM